MQGLGLVIPLSSVIDSKWAMKVPTAYLQLLSEINLSLLKKDLFLFYVCVCINVCAPQACSTQRDQKRVEDSLELEVIGGCEPHEDAGN